MTMLPPGLIAPPDHGRRVVRVERIAADLVPSARRWSRWSVAFVVLVALTLLALGLAAVDLVNG